MLNNMVGVDDDLQMMKDSISNDMDSIINKILSEKGYKERRNKRKRRRKNF